MNEAPLTHPALLPAGLHDVLPPDAEREAKSIEAIMDCFAAHGYQRVQPPLLEFEDSLFAGLGAATIEQTFRLMDPDSQRMMGLRADTTPQIARLASTKLAAAPRPLRLTYAGPCLRVRGSHLQPERQIAQAGIELIGNDTAEADAEIILTAAAALNSLGLNKISFDLTVPRLVPHLLENFEPATQTALARALDRKDTAGVIQHSGQMAGLLTKLLEACGPADRTIRTLLAISLPEAARIQAVRLADTVAAIYRHQPDLIVTTDPVEFRGYRYHTGICMTVFATGEQAELGRGGRYLCGDGEEPATGISLYPDSIMQVAPKLAMKPRLYLPFGTSIKDATACRAQGFATIAALAPHPNPVAESSRLSCSHFFYNGKITPLAQGA